MGCYFLRKLHAIVDRRLRTVAQLMLLTLYSATKLAFLFYGDDTTLQKCLMFNLASHWELEIIMSGHGSLVCNAVKSYKI